MADGGVRDVIRALRAKTVSAGCTEAEAMAAAAKAAELMSRHGVGEDDLAMTHAEAAEAVTRPTWRSDLVATIGVCTNTAPIQAIEAGRAVTIFHGHEPGPVIAVYLRDVCYRAVAREQSAFKASEFYRERRTTKTRRAAMADFTDGLVARLRSRLKEIFAPHRNADHLAAATRYVTKLYPNTKEFCRSDRDPRFHHAVSLGWQRGGDVNLNRGVATPQPKRIGGR